MVIKKVPKPIPGQKDKQKENESSNIHLDNFENIQITNEQQEVIETNHRPLSLLYCAVSEVEYDKISTWETTKEIWDKL